MIDRFDELLKYAKKHHVKLYKSKKFFDNEFYMKSFNEQVQLAFYFLKQIALNA